jgi:uncharacterized zinc-type alcohol dehydrogenase-like protein
MLQARGYAVQSATDFFEPFSFERRNPNPNDVVIAIRYCGVCHSDLHTARGEWGGARFPCVPATRSWASDGGRGRGHPLHDRRSGRGWAAWSIPASPASLAARASNNIASRALPAPITARPRTPGENTYGGYSDQIVVREEFVLNVRHGERTLAAVAPLLCRGITTGRLAQATASGRAIKVGVVGIGGLGHMGIKLAKALGAHVVAYHLPEQGRGRSELGADEVVVSAIPSYEAAPKQLPLHSQHGGAAARSQPVPDAAQRDGAMTLGRGAAEPHPSPAVAPVMKAAQPRRLADRRHRGDPGMLDSAPSTASFRTSR